MWFRKKKDDKRRTDADVKGYNDVLTDRLSTLGSYTHEYDESEREAVEARIRRMFYGAKVEGGLADRATEARETVLEEETDEFGRAVNG